VPFVLLGILTLGTGLAVGLGLSEGPVTYTASPQAETPPAVILRESPLHSFSGPLPSIPKDDLHCVAEGLNAEYPRGVVVSTSDVRAVLRRCEARQANGDGTP
jgi:hypothetical protein